MALKDIWQQDRQARQAELKARQQTVAELRSRHQAEQMEMATQLRQDLSQVLPQLRAFEADRQLEAQCAQAGRQIEVADRRQAVQAFLYDLHLRRCEAAREMHLLLETFRCDRLAQSAAMNEMLQETRRTRGAEVGALFERFALEKLDRQAAVQAIRDYVWGCQSETNLPTPVTAEAIEALLEIMVQEASSPQEFQTASLSPAELEVSSKGSDSFPANLPESTAELPAKLPAELPAESESPAELPAESRIQPSTVEISLPKKLLTILNSRSGVRLVDLESTLSVSRGELVQALQTLIRSGNVVQRDRAYYLTQPQSSGTTRVS